MVIILRDDESGTWASHAEVSFELREFLLALCGFPAPPDDEIYTSASTKRNQHVCVYISTLHTSQTRL